MEITARYEFALTLIREAGALAQRYFAHREALTVTDKGPQDVVSQADVEVKLQINAWDVLGALAVVRAAGLPSNDFLAGDGLRKGNLMITGTPGVYAELSTIWERHKRA